MQITLLHRKKVWTFLRDRFVEYEPEDESWARLFGFGEEALETAETVCPNAVCIGTHVENGKLVMDFEAMPLTDFGILEPITVHV